MPFKKGISGNPNGRKKGVKNKTNSISEVFISNLVESRLQRFEYELDKLKGEKFIKLFMKLLNIKTNEITEIATNEYLSELIIKKIKTIQNGDNK
jgi:hypothetical protein